MTFYTPDVYVSDGHPGSCHQIAVVSGDDSSSKRVCISIGIAAVCTYVYLK